MAQRLVVRNSRFKDGLLLLFAAGMLVVTIWGEEVGAIPEAGWEWIRWPAAILFGFVAALAVRGLFDRRPQIVIDGDGIFMRHWSEQVIPWTAIKSCRAIKRLLPGVPFGYQRFILLELHDPSRYPRTTRRGFSLGRGWDPGLGDITMMAVGLDQETPELVAAIRPYAAAAGVAVTGP